MKYVFIPILLFSVQAFAVGSHSLVDTSQYDEQISRIKGLEYASIALANKRIDVEITDNPIDWVQSGEQEFDAYLNQGVAFLHVFHFVDALRSFKMAHQINPQSLYPVTGMILSYAKLSSNGSTPFVEKLLLTSKELMETATEREKLWYKLAASVFIYNGADFLKQKYQSFKAPPEAYSALFEFDPNDIETLTLANHMIQQWFSEEHFLKALEIQPLHIGANHYLTHLKENRGKPREALKTAQVFAEQAPYSPHAIHMLGHLFPAIGNWSEAKKFFEKADKIHKEWSRRNEVSPLEDWHYSHNLHLLAVTQIALGEFQEAGQKLGFICFVAKVSPACLHFYSLLNISQPNKAQIYYEQMRARGIQYPVSLQEITDEIQLLKGVPFEELSQRSQHSHHLTLVNRIIQSHKSKKPTLKSELIQNIQMYVQTNFQQSGFDSWPNGLLNSLRILSVTARTKDREIYDKTLSFIKEKANEFDFDFYKSIEDMGSP